MKSCMYRVTVNHDKGSARLRIMASSKADAKIIIMKIEGCPKRAIVKVEKVKKSERI